MEQAMEKRLFTIREAAGYLGLAEQTLYNRTGPRAADPLPLRAKRFGRRILFDRKALDAFADNLPARLRM